MKKIFDIFKIKKEERVSALVALIIACALNALTVIKYHSQFSQITDNYHKLFVKTFHVAGFDPLTYSIVSHWDTEYNVYRHPLLAFFMYIPNQINQGLIMLTGINCVQFVVGAILVFCAFYSFIFLYRIFREVIGTERFDANLLSAFYFSFAYVMVSAMVPDHFIMSMIILLCTLYITGVCMKKGRQLTIWQTILLFVFTAGVSLNNGLKTYLATLFTNGRKFFSIKYFLIGVILPAALMWAFARWEYRTFVWPKEMARHEAKMKKNKEATAKIYQQYRDSTDVKDSAKVEAAVRKIIKDKAHAKYVRDHKQIWNKNTGKPIAKGEFMNWTDKTTSRSQTLVENFFGESIMLHQQNLLGDVLRNPSGYREIPVCGQLCGRGIHRCAFLTWHPCRKKIKVPLAHPDILPDGCCPPYRFGLRYQRGIYHDCPLYVCPSYRHRLPGAQGKRKEPEMGLQRIDARHHPLSVDKQRISAGRLHARIRSLEPQQVASQKQP